MRRGLYVATYIPRHSGPDLPEEVGGMGLSYVCHPSAADGDLVVFRQEDHPVVDALHIFQIDNDPFRAGQEEIVCAEEVLHFCLAGAQCLFYSAL